MLSMLRRRIYYDGDFASIFLLRWVWWMLGLDISSLSGSSIINWKPLLGGIIGYITSLEKISSPCCSTCGYWKGVWFTSSVLRFFAYIFGSIFSIWERSWIVYCSTAVMSEYCGCLFIFFRTGCTVFYRVSKTPSLFKFSFCHKTIFITLLTFWRLSCLAFC